MHGRAVAGMRTRRALLTLLMAAALLCLGGCFVGSIDELYSLPQPAADYLQLQALIDAEIAAGCEYASPSGGNNRQSVQLIDLDGDGTDEALAFLRDASQVPRICIYAATDGDYALVMAIRGDGASIGSVEYADLTGNGVCELLVSWQISAGLRMLKIYPMGDWSGSHLFTIDCNEFLVHDMDGDDGVELLVIRFDSHEGAVVDMYSFHATAEPESSSARFSTGIFSLERIRTGYLAAGMPVLVVESKYEEGWLVTDLFISRRGRLRNLSQDRDTGISNTLRQYEVYCSDVDNDGYLEIPVPVTLYAQPESAAYWATDWYGYDALGIRKLKLSTYHSYYDAWYLVLTPEWRENLTVRRQDGVSGERTVILSVLDPATNIVSDFLAVYTLTGENRRERAQVAGRFFLAEEGTTLYAAKLLGISTGQSATEEEIRGSFRLIHTDWRPGSLY